MPSEDKGKTGYEVEPVIISTESIAEISDKKNKELVERARHRKDLLCEIRGYVSNVNRYTISMSHTPQSEMIIGGTSPRYETGYQSKVEMDFEVDPEFAKSFTLEKIKLSKVKRLKFEGISSIVSGNYIRAGIFLGEAEELSFSFDPDKYPEARKFIHTENMGFNDERSYILTQRDFNEEENALYFKIMQNETSKEIRSTDFSVDFNPKNFA